MKERLTKKREDGFYDDLDECVCTQCSNKLGLLEDIEEEWKIDLLIKLKVENYYMKNYKKGSAEIFVKNFNGELCCANIHHFYPTAITVLWKGTEYNLVELSYKDYGKTWALTREELEI